MSISAIRITKMKFYLILMIAFVIQHNWSVSANVSLTPPSDSSFEAKSMLEAEPDTQYDSELLCRGEWKSPQNCNNYNCDYKATWEYIDDNDEIVFTISTKNRNKWTGIGFSENQAMPETDAVLGLVEESGRFFLMDSWLRAYEAPPLDQSQNLYNMSAWRENGITTLRFFRKRITGDSRDFQFTDTNCPYLIFPVMGGVFNAVNKRIRKHEITPIISDRKVCIRSCKPSPTITTTISTQTAVETEENFNSKKSQTYDPISKSTQMPIRPKPKDYNELSDNSFRVELKFPNAWKPSLAERDSDDYKAMIMNIKDQMQAELTKNFPTFKSLQVIELTGVHEESNSVIASMELVIDNMNEDKKSVSDDNNENSQIPTLLSTTLYSVISDELLGDLQVDPKYLMIARKEGNNSEENENMSFDKDSVKNFFNDEQTKWAIIFIGIAALIGLVLIQACCMIWRDKKNKEKKPQNDKQVPDSHWKDYAAATARSGYSYDNFGASDETDAPIKSNGQNTGRFEKQNGNKQNFKNEKMPQKYLSATLERNLSSNHNRNNEFTSAYATHDRKEPFNRSYINNSFSQQLQPDFYFMPHQRRYSGEVVRVFVDYNNPQFTPK